MTPPAGHAHRPSADTQKAMLDSPALFLRDVDPVRGRAIFTPMNEESYRDSAFLDNRIVRAAERDLVVDLDDLIELATARQAESPLIHYLFHMGHCGSTLISRILGERSCYLALREPPLLMGLSRSLRALGRPGFPLSRQRWEALRELSLLMLGKTWRSGQTALVKPTSHAGNLIPELMRHTGQERAVLLYVDLATYLATMLRPHTRRETRLFAKDFRMREFMDLSGLDPATSSDYSDAKLITLTWLLHAREMTIALEDPALVGRCLPVHFDDFLAEPVAGISRICDFLGSPMPAAERESVLSGSWLSRSAKNPAEPYDDRARDRELATLRARHAEELEAGVAWAARVCDLEAFSGLTDRFGPATARPDRS
jgi:hypothetical protein